MNHKEVSKGDTVKARYWYDHGKLQEGHEYKVVGVTPPVSMENGFTFPAYITVSLGNGKTYTSHLHHYQKV